MVLPLMSGQTEVHFLEAFPAASQMELYSLSLRGTGNLLATTTSDSQGHGTFTTRPLLAGEWLSIRNATTQQNGVQHQVVPTPSAVPLTPWLLACMLLCLPLVRIRRFQGGKAKRNGQLF